MVSAPPDPAAPQGSSGSLALSMQVRPFSGSLPSLWIGSWKTKAIKFAPAGVVTQSSWLGRQTLDLVVIYNAAVRLKITEI